MIETSPSPSTPRDPHLSEELVARLPEGWSYGAPDESDALELAALMRRHQEQARGWASAGPDDILIEVSARGYLTRENVVLRDVGGAIRGWASAHDRAAGRMLFIVIVVATSVLYLALDAMGLRVDLEPLRRDVVEGTDSVHCVQAPGKRRMVPQIGRRQQPVPCGARPATRSRPVSCGRDNGVRSASRRWAGADT